MVSKSVQTTSHSRLLGYRAALADAGIDENPEHEVYGAVDRGRRSGGHRAVSGSRAAGTARSRA